MASIEKRLEKKLKREVEKLGGIALKFPTLYESGWPDRIAIMPEGKVYWPEIKDEGESLDPLQDVAKKKLEKRAHKHFLINSDAALEEFIKAITPR